MSMWLRRLMGPYLEQAGGADTGGAGTGAADAGAGAGAADDLRSTIASAMDAGEGAAGAQDQQGAGSAGQPGAGDGAQTTGQQGAQAAEPTAADMRKYLTDNVDDPDGKLAGKSDAEIAALYAAAKGQLEEDATQQQEQQGEKLEAPQHWSAAHRELFAKQPPEVQKFLLDRHRAMEADYTRRSQELAGVKRFREQLDEVFAPFRENMQREGIDDVAAIRQLVAAHTYLQREPEKAIVWLADKYGIDLGKAVSGGAADGGQPNPEFTALREEVGQLRRHLSQSQTVQQEEQHRANLLKVEQFAQEKDEKGQLKYPYFNELAPDIAAQMRAARDSGKSIDLPTAYERAVYANPDTRAKLFAAKEAERRRETDNERRRKANAAKLASFDVRGEGSAATVAAKNDGSVRADLEAAFAGSEGRV